MAHISANVIFFVTSLAETRDFHRHAALPLRRFQSAQKLVGKERKSFQTTVVKTKWYWQNQNYEARQEEAEKKTFHFMDFRSSNQISLKLFVMASIFLRMTSFMTLIDI